MIRGIYEYSGIQRCGKSTKMVDDAIKVMLENKCRRVVANFTLDIPDVECYEMLEFMEVWWQIIEEEQTNVLMLGDELSQFLASRNYGDKKQTKLVNSLWQFPKRKIVLLYTSNIGKSVDIIVDRATWQTILPVYIDVGDWKENYIRYDVADRLELWLDEGLEMVNPYVVQSLFDTEEPVTWRKK